MAITAVYSVAGMTCEHCGQTVRSALEQLPGVQSVEVDLVPAGASRMTVTSAAPLEWDRVRDAVADAGYELAGSDVTS